MAMGLIVWIMLGLFVGYVASKWVNDSGEARPFDVLLGIIGAVVGGWLFSAFGASGATGSNLWSLLVAMVGALAVLVVWHAIRRSASPA